MFLKKLTLLREKVPSYAKYPFSIPAIQHLKELTFQKNVTFFVGKTDQANRRCLKQSQINANLTRLAGEEIIHMKCTVPVRIWETISDCHGFLK